MWRKRVHYIQAHTVTRSPEWGGAPKETHRDNTPSALSSELFAKEAERATFLRSMRTTVGVLRVGMATKSLLKTKNSCHPLCFGMTTGGLSYSMEWSIVKSDLVMYSICWTCLKGDSSVNECLKQSEGASHLRRQSYGRKVLSIQTDITHGDSGFYCTLKTYFLTFYWSCKYPRRYVMMTLPVF